MVKGKGYEITPKNLLGHELIGLRAKVLESTDASRKGIGGVVVDETQNTFTIEGKEKKVFVLPKKECIFEFDLDGEKVVVKGKDVAKRPEDRVKEWRNL